MTWFRHFRGEPACPRQMNEHVANNNRRFCLKMSMHPGSLEFEGPDHHHSVTKKRNCWRVCMTFHFLNAHFITMTIASISLTPKESRKCYKKSISLPECIKSMSPKLTSPDAVKDTVLQPTTPGKRRYMRRGSRCSSMFRGAMILPNLMYDDGDTSEDDISKSEKVDPGALLKDAVILSRSLRVLDIADWSLETVKQPINYRKMWLDKTVESTEGSSQLLCPSLCTMNDST